jgi:hypothetical protein
MLGPLKNGSISRVLFTWFYSLTNCFRSAHDTCMQPKQRIPDIQNDPDLWRSLEHETLEAANAFFV